MFSMLTSEGSSILTKPTNSMLNMSTLSERLKTALDETGVTQAEIARACRVTPSAVSQWLNGHTKDMKMAHIFAAADRLGVRDRWLAVGTGPMKEESWSPAAREIADYVNQLPERRQHGIREGFGLYRKHESDDDSSSEAS